VLLVIDDGLTLDRPAVFHAAKDRPILFAALSDTLTVTTVPDSALEPLREDEVLRARVLAAA
jgi:hypothetical protein